MKKKFLLYLFLAIISGLILGNLFYQKYEVDNNLDIDYNSYLILLGVYDNYDTLKEKVGNIDSYMVVERNDKYYVYVGITSKKKNAIKIQNVYKDKKIDVAIKKSVIDNIEFMSNLEQFDVLLDSASNDNDVLSINEVILSSYEEMVINK